MCVRQVFFCVDCRTYSRIPDVTVPSSSTFGKTLVFDEPCGLSYCDYFDQLFPFVERPFNPCEVGQPCTARCDPLRCTVFPVLESCCKPSERSHLRLVTVKMIKEGYGFTAVSIPEQGQRSQRPRTPLATSMPPPEWLSNTEMCAVVSERCSWAICRSLFKGGSTLLFYRDLRLQITSGPTGYVVVKISSLDPSYTGFQEFELSFGWLLCKVFWREEKERRSIQLSSIFC